MVYHRYRRSYLRLSSSSDVIAILARVALWLFVCVAHGQSRDESQTFPSLRASLDISSAHYDRGERPAGSGTTESLELTASMVGFTANAQYHNTDQNDPIAEAFLAYSYPLLVVDLSAGLAYQHRTFKGTEDRIEWFVEAESKPANGLVLSYSHYAKIDGERPSRYMELELSRPYDYDAALSVRPYIAVGLGDNYSEHQDPTHWEAGVDFEYRLDNHKSLLIFVGYVYPFDEAREAGAYAEESLDAGVGVSWSL